MSTYNIPVSITLFTLLCVLFPAAASARDAAATISVSGQASVSATPDMAVLVLGTITQGKTARQALDANNRKMAALVRVMRQQGIAETDIQTSNFSIYPELVHSDQRDEKGYTRAPEIRFYNVSNNISVRLRQIDRLGAVLDQSVSAGANAINDVRFALQDTEKLLDKARALAMTRATENARLYARAADVHLGEILSISERQKGNPEPFIAAARMDQAMFASVPVMSGQLDYSVTVDVRWEIARQDKPE